MPLSTGCLGACTYCKTKHARGELGSYSLQALTERVRQAAADPLVRHFACVESSAATQTTLCPKTLRQRVKYPTPVSRL